MTSRDDLRSLAPPSPSFVELVQAGRALAEEVDAYAETWYSAFEGISEPPVGLHTWLGMTWDEYRRVGAWPSRLGAVIVAREHGLSLDDAFAEQDASVLTLAARGASRDEQLREFLRSEDIDTSE